MPPPPPWTSARSGLRWKAPARPPDGLAQRFPPGRTEPAGPAASESARRQGKAGTHGHFSPPADGGAAATAALGLCPCTAPTRRGSLPATPFARPPPGRRPRGRGGSRSLGTAAARALLLGLPSPARPGPAPPTYPKRRSSGRGLEGPLPLSRRCCCRRLPLLLQQRTSAPGRACCCCYSCSRGSSGSAATALSRTPPPGWPPASGAWPCSLRLVQPRPMPRHGTAGACPPPPPRAAFPLPVGKEPAAKPARPRVRPRTPGPGGVRGWLLGRRAGLWLSAQIWSGAWRRTPRLRPGGGCVCVWGGKGGQAQAHTHTRMQAPVAEADTAVISHEQNPLLSHPGEGWFSPTPLPGQAPHRIPPCSGAPSRCRPGFQGVLYRGSGR